VIYAEIKIESIVLILRSLTASSRSVSLQRTLVAVFKQSYFLFIGPSDSSLIRSITYYLPAVGKGCKSLEDCFEIIIQPEHAQAIAILK
jgi:hypothetical protein